MAEARKDTAGQQELRTAAPPPDQPSAGASATGPKGDDAPAASASTTPLAGTETTAAGPPAPHGNQAATPASAAPTATTATTADARATQDAKTTAVGEATAGTAREVEKATAKRRFRPLHATGRAARGVADWARGPSGRVVVPGVVVAGLVTLAVTSGAYLVPRALEVKPTPSATPAFGGGLPGSVPPPVLSSPSGLPGAGQTGLPLPGTTTGLPGVPPATVNAARPADSLADWAQRVGTRVGIPVVAVQAYGYAELVTARTTPACRLNWTTLAAIGKVESSHGSYNGAVLGADGVAQPTILGLPLDGQGGRQLVADTDRGVLDKDTTYDRAIGPMQFIPATWTATAVDADRDGVANPNDIDDAALTAASYLCKDGRDLSDTATWWDAILSYNAVRPYADKVFSIADDYGRRTRA